MNYGRDTRQSRHTGLCGHEGLFEEGYIYYIGCTPKQAQGETIQAQVKTWGCQLAYRHS